MVWLPLFVWTHGIVAEAAIIVVRDKFGHESLLFCKFWVHSSSGDDTLSIEPIPEYELIDPDIGEGKALR